MSCRLDVKKAILKNVTDRFTKNRSTYRVVMDDTIEIINIAENQRSKAIKASQAKIIAMNLADMIRRYTDGHVMGRVTRVSEYDPYRIVLTVSPAYIEAQYRLLPKDQQTDPQDNKNIEISKSDKIIFGHPGIGKTFLRQTRSDFIDVDNDYKEEHAMQKILRARARNSGNPEDLKDWEDYIKNWWNKVKQDAKSSGKRILVSNLPILRMFPQDFDKVITISNETFVQRSRQRDDYIKGQTESWKKMLYEEIKKIPAEKVISTDKYLSDMLPSGDMISPEDLPPIFPEC